MIYVSSSCINRKTIREAVTHLADMGFTNIELSGGTERYSALEEDLIALRSSLNLNYLCHNYFPPPVEHFVLNLASQDPVNLRRSIQHVKQTMDMSLRLNANKYAFHAGFLIDIQVNELGQKIQKRSVADRKASIQQFCAAVREVKTHNPNFQIYIENNVLSHANYKTYGQNNPLLMVTSDEILEVLEMCGAKLLLDLAHLKVSCRTLGISLEKEFTTLLPHADYFHISDNDGTADTNGPIIEGELITLVGKYRKHLMDKDFTIEVYGSDHDIKASYQSLEKVLT